MGFFENINNLRSDAEMKPLSDEIKILSFSILLDVAGYKKCVGGSCADYLKTIRDANTCKELKTKVSQLANAKQNTKQAEEKHEEFYAKCNEILSDKKKGDIKEIQKSYSDLIKALDLLYES